MIADRIADFLSRAPGESISRRTVLSAGAAVPVALDSSVGGIGGCPYAPGAPGNVSTEALVRAFPGGTGVDLETLATAGRAITAAIQGSGSAS